MKKLMTSFIHWKADHRAVPLILFLLLTSNFITAQVKVSGTVSDEKGLSIPGANVSVAGSKATVSTDFDGKYSIDVPANSTLLFSFIGFATQKVAVDGKSTINVILKSNAEDLKDVVVIGYGTQRRKDVNSAISSVAAKDIENLKVASFDQMLQGKAAGVVVNSNSGEPGSNVSVRIRGVSSLTGTNEPLYVIDGVPISGDARNSSTSGRNAAGDSNFSNNGNITVSPLALINPSDIESIDILKDASATAIYGSRGANGVIIVTTKSGKKGTGKLSFENSYSISNLPKKLHSMNLQQYATHQNALADVYDPSSKRPEFAHPELLGKGTDWQDAIYETGLMSSNQLSFSGGKEGINYYISGGVLNQEGIVIESGFKRYNVRANIDAKVNSFIKVGINVSGAITDEKLTLNGQFNGVVATSLLATPDVAVRELDGAFAGPTSGISFVNPVATSLLGSNTLVRKNYSGNFYTQVDILKGLEYRFEAGGYIYDNLGQRFDPMYSLGNAVKNYANLYYNPSSGNSWNLKNMLTYRKTIDKHNFTILAVQESNRAHWEGYSMEGNGYKDNSNQTLAGGDLAKAVLKSTYSGTQTLSSYLGRVVYDYADKYGISAAIRTDGSSKFFVGNKWGVFSSASGSWKISNESFMESTRKYVDNIKLRFGWGQTGNNQIGNNLYDSNLHVVVSSMGTSYLPSNTPNKDLKWETQDQTNLGLDFTLFQSKFTASVDVYKKVSKNFLYQVPLPNYLSGGGDYEGGVNPPYFNLGSMQNKGIEVTLGYHNKFSENFSWDSSLNFTKYENKVTDMAGLNIIKTTNTLAYSTVSVSRTQEGLPIGSFLGYEAVGIYRTDEDLLKYGHVDGSGNRVVLKNGTNSLLPDFVKGDVIYKDLNNDGKIDQNDLTNIGNPNPKFTYGFTNNFKYKNVDLSIFLQGTAGNKLLNLTRASGTMNSNLGTNYLTEAADFYSANNLDASLPKPSSYDHINNAVSTRMIENGSYLRIQNVTLGYSLPSDIISKIKLTRLRIYASGQNLFTFTKYTGYDPEVGAYNQDALMSGIDNGRYPVPRLISFGFNVEF
ncbi:TonB-dependent receptor [Flavobacterium sp. SORGH_AS_0622]|jgi:TonB-linked SusC/RagA family outer membrane protein|uniref:SusC/RagA family TonB-linked outer membrane protein n=1 Tax=Flavobacterium sp. SORGH_AS_0622 TaxID=3041772 RepID=UPI00277DC836|nr:TonB-dependent receptor [Flavobacterium sp. SORGH_AS_0622]MDQ1167071.1 TonB-linked SusC/RagA family outer membrane protein [Flavobacterium sp. SORGH_AS_0622]